MNLAAPKGGAIKGQKRTRMNPGPSMSPTSSSTISKATPPLNTRKLSPSSRDSLTGRLSDLIDALEAAKLRNKGAEEEQIGTPPPPVNLVTQVEHKNVPKTNNCTAKIKLTPGALHTNFSGYTLVDDAYRSESSCGEEISRRSEVSFRKFS